MPDSQFVAVVNSLVPAANLKLEEQLQKTFPEGIQESSVGGCGWELVLFSTKYTDIVSSVYIQMCFVL